MFTVSNLVEWLYFIGSIMLASGLLCSNSYIKITNQRVLSLRGHLFNIFYFNNYLSKTKVSNNFPLAIMVMLVGGAVYASTTFYLMPHIPFLDAVNRSLVSIITCLVVSLVVSFFLIQAYYFLVHILLGTIPDPPTALRLVLPLFGSLPFLLVWYVSICIFCVLILPFLLFHGVLKGDKVNVITSSGLLLLIVAFILRQAWLL